MSTQSKSRLRASLLIGLALSGATAAAIGWINSNVLEAQTFSSTSPVKASERMEREDLSRLKMAEQKLLNSKGDNHPALVNIRQQIELLKQQIEAVRMTEREQAKDKPAVARTGAATELRNDGQLPTSLDAHFGATRNTGPVQGIGGQFGPTPVYQVPQNYYPYGPSWQPVVAVQNEETRELQAAYEAIRSEESDEKIKDEARAKIVEILSKQFDADLEQRTAQIEQLEKQITSLKEQIAKRRTAKDRLIELRIELMLNEGEGLGFPNAWQQPMRGNVGPMLPPGGYQPSTITFPQQLPATNARR